MLKRFLQAREGSVFVMVAAGLMVLVGAVGVAVDVGRGQMAQTKLQNALDAAGLAAGASISTTNLEAEVNKYLNVNFAQGTQGAVITNVAPVLSNDGRLLTVTADARMPTTFMNIFGFENMALQATTEVTRESKGMELSIVLDVTGSMCQPCTKIDALKTASHDLIEILFGEGKTTADKLWVGIVPFAMAVNVGTDKSTWLDPAYNGLDWGTTSWAGCVEARWASGRDITEAPPSAELFRPFYGDDNDSYNNWIRETSNTVTDTTCNRRSTCTCANYPCTTTTSGNVTTRNYCSGSGSTRSCYRDTTTTGITYSITSARGPNRYCPANTVTPLTNDRATLDNAITALVTDGGTHIPTGAVWGWRMLSEQWRGFWGGSMNSNNLPLNYDTDLMVKAAIIMTDGENTMYDNADGAYGYLWQNQLGITGTITAAKGTTKLNEKVSAICEGMKQQGIVVYTVVFDLNDANVGTMMRNCATQPDYYFNTPDANALRQAFRTIGDSLANLRISK